MPRADGLAHADEAVRVAGLGVPQVAGPVAQRAHRGLLLSDRPAEQSGFVGQRHHAVVEPAHVGQVAAVGAHAGGPLVAHVDLLPVQRQRLLLVAHAGVEFADHADRILPWCQQLRAAAVSGCVDRHGEVVGGAELQHVAPEAAAGVEPAAGRPGFVEGAVGVVAVHVEGAEVITRPGILEEGLVLQRRRVGCPAPAPRRRWPASTPRRHDAHRKSTSATAAWSRYPVTSMTHPVPTVMNTARKNSVVSSPTRYSSGCVR